MNGFRDWMYNKWSDEFYTRVESFCNWAFGTQNQLQVRCPCNTCKCGWPELDRNDVTMHLYQHGFQPGYHIWNRHGENYGHQGVHYDIGGAGPSSATTDQYDEVFQSDRGFVNDWFPQNEETPHYTVIPNPSAKDLYDLISAADKPMYEGHDQSLLHWITEAMAFKTTYNSSNAQVEAHIRGCRNTALPEMRQYIPDSYYKLKKLVMKLGLSVIKYDVCDNNCFLYYKQFDALRSCPVCHKPRYKERGSGSKKDVPFKKLWYFPITPRLQRLYMSKQTAEHMTWHTRCRGPSDKMVHPAHGEAWKYFDRCHPTFAAEDRNVRIGLCSDGFCPTNSMTTGYSCWPVFITPYNFPPDMCMRQEFIFMSLMISGPSSPGNKIDVLLRPLIDELRSLWIEGAVTWDCVRQENFVMRVAVMWTVSDFPAYGMLSGWSTHGRLSCPYCQGDTAAFYLKHGQKHCWFDCHRAFLPTDHTFRYNVFAFMKGKLVYNVMSERKTTEENLRALSELPDVDTLYKGAEFPGKGQNHNWTKKPIMAELLPYWSTLLVPHTLDVMHCEKNFFDNILYTVMDDKSTKDNLAARVDLKTYTTRRALYLDSKTPNKKPKATYALNKDQKKAVCEWLKGLRFPDGHVSNLAKCVKKSNYVGGFKTHDCHVFMQRLLPIAFKNFVPDQIWEAITEVSNAFRSICASEVSVPEMVKLVESVVETLCKLELIFPPGFFDCMEHLLIHLPYEAQVCGPVFYHWMYPFERKLGVLKRMARQKNRLEGSICEAYLMTEITNFCKFYFGHVVERLHRNEHAWAPQFEGQHELFIPKGRALRVGKKEKTLNQIEYHQALLCIIMNCPHARYLISIFDGQVCYGYNAEALEYARTYHLVPWLKGYPNIEQYGSGELKLILEGGSDTVTEYQGYTVNGFKFQTKKYCASRPDHTMNSGISLKWADDTGNLINSYGMLKEIIQLRFHSPGRPMQHIYLFKCDWYNNEFVTVDKYGLIELRHDKIMRTNEPYILANTASQVYFAEYPKTSGRSRKVWSVCPIRARHMIDVSSTQEKDESQEEDVPPEIYQEEAPPPNFNILGEASNLNQDIPLADTTAGSESD